MKGQAALHLSFGGPSPAPARALAAAAKRRPWLSCGPLAVMLLEHALCDQQARQGLHPRLVAIAGISRYQIRFQKKSAASEERHRRRIGRASGRARRATPAVRPIFSFAEPETAVERLDREQWRARLGAEIGPPDAAQARRSYRSHPTRHGPAASPEPRAAG